jgi:hypothetical protein
VAGLAKGGPIHKQAESIMRLLRSKRTAVHFVTVLEEMPVQETLDGLRDVADVGLPTGAVIVNMARRAMLSDEDLAAAEKGALDRGAISAALARVGVPADEEIVEGLLGEAREHAVRVGLERAERRDLDAAGRPVYVLPALADGIDLGGLYRLADELRDQGRGA